MPNSITATGLTTATQAELLAQLTAAYQAIYGADINLSSDTPDGQQINIFIQAALDIEDLLTQIYNNFDPDSAIGNVLDQRVTINGIQRQAGTFTVTNVTITTSQSVNLYGLDQTAQPVFTVADNAGNQWQLQFTQLGFNAPSGTALAFQSATPGANLTIPNTITIHLNFILVVTAINNPTTYTSLGLNEETDAALKIRRQKSVALPSQGYQQGLLAALENLNGLTYAAVYENTTGSTNGDGVPGHSIWVIVAGSATNANIANAIYVKRNAGCGMYGATTYTVIQVDGTGFTVAWDIVTPVPLYIKFTATSLDGVNPPNIAAIRSGLVTSFTPGVSAQVDINQLASAVQDIDPNTLVTSAGFNIETTQVITFSGIAASGTFKLSYNGTLTSTLNWNDSGATIQSALRAITGLSSITVAGTIGSQTLTVTMTGVTNPFMIGVSNNTLLTGGSVAITLNFLSAFTNTLPTATKNKQFTIAASEIVILTMILSAPSITYTFSSGVVTHTNLTIAHTATTTFSGLGGYGALVYSVSSSTGSAINASTGAYTAGTAGTDTVTVTDAQANTATCTVTIT